MSSLDSVSGTTLVAGSPGSSPGSTTSSVWGPGSVPPQAATNESDRARAVIRLVRLVIADDTASFAPGVATYEFTHFDHTRHQGRDPTAREPTTGSRVGRPRMTVRAADCHSF